jgi:hypothetical protein
MFFFFFFGYSSNKKGYRCLDPLTNCIYISRHVVFDETQFSGMNIVPASTPHIDTSPGSSSQHSSNSLTLSSFVFMLPNNSDLSLSTTHFENSHIVSPEATISPTNDSPIVGSPTNDPPTSSSPISAQVPSRSHTLTSTPIPVLATNHAHVPSNSHDLVSPSMSMPTTDHASVGLAIEPSIPNATSMVTRSQTHSLKPKQFPQFLALLFYQTPIGCFVLCIPFT